MSEYGPADGLLVWSTPYVTVGLIVRDAVVVDGPPYVGQMRVAGRAVLGCDARWLWRQGVAQYKLGVRVSWRPGVVVEDRSALFQRR